MSLFIETKQQEGDVLTTIKDNLQTKINTKKGKVNNEKLY